MSRLFRSLLLVGLLGLASVAGLMAWPIGVEPPSALDELEGNVDRGAYLARASGCIACHSDFEAGDAPLAGGAPLETDFGTFYPPNLTTDPDHGMGAWTVSDFARAVRQGVSPGGDTYYPTFTYPFYAGFTDQDIADLWAAFQTVPSVPEPSPEHEAGSPFDQRWGSKLWRAAYLSEPVTVPEAGRSEARKLGKWLVRGVLIAVPVTRTGTWQARGSRAASLPETTTCRVAKAHPPFCLPIYRVAVGTRIAWPMPCEPGSHPMAMFLEEAWQKSSTKEQRF